MPDPVQIVRHQPADERVFGLSGPEKSQAHIKSRTLKVERQRSKNKNRPTSKNHRRSGKMFSGSRFTNLKPSNVKGYKLLWVFPFNSQLFTLNSFLLRGHCFLTRTLNQLFCIKFFAVSPQPFQVIESTCLFREYMNHKIEVVH